MSLEEYRSSLTAAYLTKGQFRHPGGSVVRLFPYVTTSVSTSAGQELSSFAGICGEMLRVASGVPTPKVGLSPDGLLDSITERVTPATNELHRIVRKLAFDEDKNLIPFDASMYPYLPITKDPTARRIGAWANDVLLAANGLEHDLGATNGSMNVLQSLILDCLPKPDGKTRKKADAPFISLDVGISNSFHADWEYLRSSPELAKSAMPEMIKYYSFVYQVRLIETLDSFFSEAAVQPVYFTLEWESCSKSRQSYMGGWQRIEPKLKRMFSHVNCLELLNSIQVGALKAPYTYRELRAWSATAREDDRRTYEGRLDCLIEFYRGALADLRFDWTKYESKLPKNQTGDRILDGAHFLFQLIDCQFKYSHRNAPAGRFSSWLAQLALKSFIRRRGRIGHTLALSRDQVMFLVRLIVGREPRIRLHQLWDGFIARGISFDAESKRQIVASLERVGLLEKKSDSGDAQYVRAIV